MSGVSKRFGKTIAVDSLDLEVRHGEVLGLLGANGAGKTTAISLMLGLTQPDAGSVALFDLPPLDIRSRRRIGVMLQDTTLAPEPSVAESVELVASYYPDPMPVCDALQITGTTGLASTPYGRLSLGQQRQAQFAIAICGRPQLLFLDEPTVGLDTQSREKMWQVFKNLVGHRHCSIVLTSHNLEEVEALADRVVVLSGGKILAEGRVGEICGIVKQSEIRCRTSTLTLPDVRSWPGVENVDLDGDSLRIVTTDAGPIVHRLSQSDGGLRELEVRRGGLAEALSVLADKPQNKATAP